MKNTILKGILLTVMASLLLSCTRNEQAGVNQEDDVNAIKMSIKAYDEGWDAKNLEQVLAHYSEDVDWTNAFGARVKGKSELRSLLETIFGLDFVMAGANNYQDPEFNFLTDDIALVRSVNIRTGQQWPDGTPMNDRVINHLRVFQRIDGNWLCINHMISQAHETRGE